MKQYGFVASVLIGTLVSGIAAHSDLKKVGRMGIKAIAYFEAVTTLALCIGLAAINLSKAGAGVHLPPPSGETLQVQRLSATETILHIFPENVAKSVSEGQILQVVVFSILFGIALAMVREERRQPLLNLAESLAETMFIAAVAEPVSIAFGTSSCEAALPRAMEAMEAIGVPRPVVAFVMPTGHSFNLDGSTLYLSLASIFVAQAAGVHLSLGRQLLLMLTLMLTSKGVAGVSRAAIVILLGTAGSFRPTYGAALHSARYRPIDGYGAHLGQRAGQLPGNRGGLALGGRFRKRATIAGGDERGYRLRHRRGITVYPTAPLRFNRTA